MTPSRSGRTPDVPGVRPSISLGFASDGEDLLPARESRCTATTLGSQETMPLPFT